MNLQEGVPEITAFKFICKVDVCQSRPNPKKILYPQLSYVHGRGNQSLNKNPD